MDGLDLESGCKSVACEKEGKIVFFGGIYGLDYERRVRFWWEWVWRFEVVSGIREK